MMQEKTRKHILKAIKIIIVVAAYAFVVYKVAFSPDIEQVPLYFTNISITKWLIFAGILLLMPINWALETWKWQKLVSPLEHISFAKSIKAVMTGVTVGTVTPNRAGEFAGRVLFVSEGKRASASYLTIFGNIAQFCATIIFGIIGLLYLWSNSSNDIPYPIFLAIGIVCGAAIIAIYFKFDNIVNTLRRTKIIKKHLDKYVPQCTITTKSKFTAIALSIFRYTIFSTQFYLSLLFFGIDIPAADAFAAIFATYICIYIIPNIAAAELGIRTSFAIIFIGLFASQDTAVTLSSLLLYLVNVGIPILLGGVFLVKEKK